MTFGFLTSCQAIWRPLKSSLFAKMVGAGYVPTAKLLVFLYLIPLILIYSKLVDRLRRHQLVYLFTIFHGIGGLIFAFLLAHPSIGVANTATSPGRILGWALYFFMESFGAFLATVFWAFADSINNPKDARRHYGFFVSGSKVGGVLAAGGLYLLLSFCPLGDATLLPGTILVGSILLLCAAASIKCLMEFVPGKLLHGYEAAYQVEKARDREEEIEKPTFIGSIKSAVEGLTSIIKIPYVAGISIMVILYEAIIVMFDYQVLLIADKSSPSVGALSAYYALYYFFMHGAGLLITLFLTVPLQRIFKIEHAILVCPALSFLLIIFAYFFPTAGVLFAALVLLRALNYALNHPTREALYIPTTKAIKFKAKAWTDAFGSRVAKATGSVFNIATSTIGGNAIMAISTSISAVMIAIWLVVAKLLGIQFRAAVNTNAIIGEERSRGTASRTHVETNEGEDGGEDGDDDTRGI